MKKTDFKWKRQILIKKDSVLALPAIRHLSRRMFTIGGVIAVTVAVFHRIFPWHSNGMASETCKIIAAKKKAKIFALSVAGILTVRLGRQLFCSPRLLDRCQWSHLFFFVFSFSFSTKQNNKKPITFCARTASVRWLRWMLFSFLRFPL